MTRLSLLLVLLGLLLIGAGCPKRDAAGMSTIEPPAPPAKAVKPAKPAQAEPAQKEGSTVGFKVTSPAFKDGDRMPVKYTEDGANFSPELAWAGPPAQTAGFALIMNDPDAPSGDWVHWVVYGLPATLTGLPEGIPTSAQPAQLKGGQQGRNSYGKLGYHGPGCPPGKVHHYVFKVYALDAAIALPPGATKAQLLKAMEGHILGQAQLVGTYSR